MFNPNILRKAGILGAAVGLNAVSLLLAVVAIAVPRWIESSFQSSGLFLMCVIGICGPLSPHYITGALKAVWAMMFLGMIGLIISLVCGFLKIKIMKDKLLLRPLAAWIATSAGVFLLIGAIIFAADPDGKTITIRKNTVKQFFGDESLHIGFVLAIMASVLSFVTTGFYLKAKDSD